MPVKRSSAGMTARGDKADLLLITVIKAHDLNCSTISRSVESSQAPPCTANANICKIRGFITACVLFFPLLEVKHYP